MTNDIYNEHIKEEEIYNKYLVLKWDNIFKYLTQGQLDILDLLISKIEYGMWRKENKELSNKYLVVNCDEPYADKVKQLIMNRE